MIVASSRGPDLTYNDRHNLKQCCRGTTNTGKGLVPPLVHLLLSGGPSDQARAARALSNMATDSSVKEQIVTAGKTHGRAASALPAYISKSTMQLAST